MGEERAAIDELEAAVLERQVGTLVVVAKWKGGLRCSRHHRICGALMSVPQISQRSTNGRRRR